MNYTDNTYGNIELADGRSVRLTQQAYNTNGPDGSPVWAASGYLSTENEDEETGPTVTVIWASLGAEEAEDDADWSMPESVMHYSEGELQIA